MTDSALLAAIDADPQAKSLADSGNDAACAARLNDPSGPNAGPVVRESVTKNTFLTWLVSMAFALSTKDAATQATWDRILGLVKSSDGPYHVAVIGPQLQAAKAIGLTSDASIAALTVFTGSQAEVLWGEGTNISPADVSRVYAPRRPGGIVGGQS